MQMQNRENREKITKTMQQSDLMTLMNILRWKNQRINPFIYLEHKDSSETVVAAAVIANQQRKTRLGHYCFCLLHSRLSPVCYSARYESATKLLWLILTGYYFSLYFMSCDYYDRFSTKKIATCRSLFDSLMKRLMPPFLFLSFLNENLNKLTQPRTAK